MSIATKLKTSRRTFLKGMAAVGTASVLYGCGGAGDDEVIVAGEPGVPPPDLNTEEYFFGTGGHNCGAKCLLKGWVKEGRILRITSSEDGYSGGVWQDPDSHNNTQSRACARCRGYRMRLYHPGRLKYPMKQTKKRGDLTGFVRISWEQALNEIARKHKATIGKYGPESINSLYACGNYSGTYQGGGANGPWNGRAGASALLNMLGGATGYYSNYSFHQQGTFGTFFTGYGTGVAGANPSANTVATCLNTMVLWGSNCLSTINNVANSTVQSCRKLRERGGNVIFIGPYLSDQGVNTATEWIQMRPYTDAALVAGMIHEMIIQTFNADGSLKSGHWLDPEYLDIMVHGFFDSPGYWVHPTTGVINTADADPLDGSVRINPVPAGESFSAYIMGNDPRLTLARYDAANNYTAQQFKAVQTYRNAGVCSYPVARTVANTDYSRKKDYLKAKTPEWAEAITGVPREKIRELAQIFCDAASHPLYSEYCGGQQKQAEGVNNMFAVQALHIITQTYGRPGETYNRGQAGVTTTTPAAEQLPDMALNRPAAAGGYNLALSLPTPYVSCTMWHAAVKFGLGDDLKNNQYTAKYIPDWDPSEIASGAAYHDDGGAKALVKMKRDAAGGYIENADGYFEWEVGPDSKPIYSGYRLIYNMGGNIPINQHQNANDSSDMLASLPLTTDPDNPDTFCIVNFDNFLSPSPRWSDYVLPAATVWEMDNRIGISLGNNIITPIITQPPGESKDTWALCVEFLRAFEKIDPTKAGCAEAFIGSDTPSGPVYADDTYIKKFKRAYEGTTFALGSKFYGLTFEEALKVQYSNQTPAPESVVADSKNALRTAVDAYLATLSAPSSTPFVSPVAIPNAGNTTYGGRNSYPYSMFPNDVTPPNIPNKLILYSEIFVFQYVNRFRKWHGYITDPAKRGQKNTDPEGDPIIYPIPMYFPYEDYFMEAYGGLDKLPTAGNRFLLTTTHDRYRSHSTLAEAPYLRELTHRIRGGKLYSGNDWGTYAISEIKDGAISRINKSVAERDFTRASWTEVYMNAEDAAELNIADGELIQLENPIGAVRVIARLTNRNVRGYLDLHQGCWYDPDPEDGVDDGGCANTLMATKPSRYDHGNGQQSAMVSIKKVQW
jgi:anaerobic selenocysteine-containing dehydrogenase